MTTWSPGSSPKWAKSGPAWSVTPADMSTGTQPTPRAKNSDLTCACPGDPPDSSDNAQRPCNSRAGTRLARSVATNRHDNPPQSDKPFVQTADARRLGGGHLYLN